MAKWILIIFTEKLIFVIIVLCYSLLKQSNENMKWIKNKENKEKNKENKEMKIWKNRIIVSDPQFDGTKIVNKLWYSCFVSKLNINYGFEKGKLGKRLTLKNSHRYSEAQWVLSCVQNKTKTGSKRICNRTFIPSKVIRKYCPVKKWGNGSVQLHFGRKSLGL